MQQAREMSSHDPPYTRQVFSWALDTQIISLTLFGVWLPDYMSEYNPRYSLLVNSSLVERSAEEELVKASFGSGYEYLESLIYV